MNLLLDTHVLLWGLENSPRLGAQARARITDASNTVWVSTASAWEIAIKVKAGRLELSEPPEVCVPRELERAEFVPLPVALDHALGVGALPPDHADPFDRLLIAQAVAEGLTIVTADRAFAAYNVPMLAAER